jgi:hypothetical protein
MTTEALIEALKEPVQWEAFDYFTGARGGWESPQVWQGWTVYKLANAEFRRIPAPPVESGLPAEMNAERATEWLEADKSRVVADRVGDTWHFNGKHCVCARTGAGIFANHFGPFRPLAPLTRGQLAEIERLTKELSGSRELAAPEQARINSMLRANLEASSREIRSTLGSRDAALAALEQERALRIRYREYIEHVVRTGKIELTAPMPGKESGE